MTGSKPFWFLTCLFTLSGCVPSAARPEPRDVSSVPTVANAAPPDQLVRPLGPTAPPMVAVALGTVTADSPTLSPAMPVATPAVRFTVDRDVVDASGCRLLSWSASAVRRLRLGGKAVPSVGNQSVCPDKETTYYLWFEGQDGRPGDRSVTIRLATPTSMPIAGIAPEEERPARETELPPTLEPTPCDTECVVIMPTETPRPTRTARPTRPADPTEEPRPTEPPATAEPPTAPPDPTDEPAATEVPKPTEEPSPDPPR